jgi:hypothetical protein
LVTKWLLLRTALLFVRRAVRLVYAETRGPVDDGVGSVIETFGSEAISGRVDDCRGTA